MEVDSDITGMETSEVCERIQRLTTEMMSFWKSAHGWAPIEAAGLLSESALQWQSSLSGSLSRWIGASSEGDLILAWANLGALVEGLLKLFLSVYYNDYSADAEAIKGKRGTVIDPDECSLEPLRQFFVRRIWTHGMDWNPFVEYVQSKRNAIHAFKHRDIGTIEDWKLSLSYHLSFARDINISLPYPDDCYVPRDN